MKILCVLVLLTQSSQFLLASDLSTLFSNWSVVKREHLIKDGIEIDTVENTVKEMDDKNFIATYRKGVINRSYKYMFLLAYYGQLIIFEITDIKERQSFFKKIYLAVIRIETFMNRYNIPMKNLTIIRDTIFLACVDPNKVGVLETISTYIKTQFPNPKAVTEEQLQYSILNSENCYNWDIYRSVIPDGMTENIYPPKHLEKRIDYFSVIDSLTHKIKQEYVLNENEKKNINIVTFYTLNNEINKEEEEEEENEKRLKKILNEQALK